MPKIMVLIIIEGLHIINQAIDILTLEEIYGVIEIDWSRDMPFAETVPDFGQCTNQTICTFIDLDFPVVYRRHAESHDSNFHSTPQRS